MTYTTANKACMKMTESRNRLHSAVDSLKKDIRHDLARSRKRLVEYGTEIQHTGQGKIAEKPFAAIAIAFTAGFLLGKWTWSHLACRQFEPTVNLQSCSGI